EIAARRPEQSTQTRDPERREHGEARRAEREIEEQARRPQRGAEQPAHHEHGERLQRHGHRGAGERHRYLGRGRDESRTERHGERAAGGESARQQGQGGGLRLVHQSISTLRATALPPPRHRVASPVVCCLSLRAYRSVVRTRAPEAPIGWPSAMAPPFTLTRAQSHPSARAPSFSPGALPEVTVPFSWNDGLSAASASSDVSARGPSSLSTTAGPFLPGISTATVSALKRHAAIAATAFWWLVRANSSWSRRDTPACFAVYSARLPMWEFEKESHKPSWIIPS